MRIPIYILLYILPVFTQAQDAKELVRRYFNDVRKGTYPAIPKPLSLPENAKSTLIALQPYWSDTLVDVRSKAYTITHIVGDNSRQPHIREAVVTHLIAGCKDKDGGNVGMVLDYLTEFRNTEFTVSAKDSIRSLFRQKIAHTDKLLKLIGFLELTDLKETIRPYTQAGNTQPIRWASLVSLARMNDAAAASEVMRRVRKLSVNDDIIYKIFPDLAYSRNQEAINYMVEVMQSDEKNCFSADAEREEPIPCGYRIMEQLAPVIEGYPLELDESGDIKTKDYTAALKKVREWFIKHKEYTILRDKF
jgi:hypothetical protein